MNFKSFDFLEGYLKEDIKFIYETFHYKTIGELMEHFDHHEETEEEKEERKINEIMQSMHKHKRKEKQEPMELRKDPSNVLFDEELMLKYIYKEYDEDRRWK